MQVELSDNEVEGIVSIIDGTIDTMLCDLSTSDPEVVFWFDILRKLGAADIVETFLEAND